MKPGARLINVGRGAIVNTDALLAVAQRKKTPSAAADHDAAVGGRTGSCGPHGEPLRTPHDDDAPLRTPHDDDAPPPPGGSATKSRRSAAAAPPPNNLHERQALTRRAAAEYRAEQERKQRESEARASSRRPTSSGGGGSISPTRSPTSGCESSRTPTSREDGLA